MSSTKNVSFWPEAPILLPPSDNHFMLNRPLRGMGAAAAAKKSKKLRNHSSKDLRQDYVKNIVNHRRRHFWSS